MLVQQLLANKDGTARRISKGEIATEKVRMSGWSRRLLRFCAPLKRHGFASLRAEVLIHVNVTVSSPSSVKSPIFSRKYHFLSKTYEEPISTGTHSASLQTAQPQPSHDSIASPCLSILIAFFYRHPTPEGD